MEDKLDLIIKNQEILNRNQITIFKELLKVESRLFRSRSSEFLSNFLADIAGTIVSLTFLEDIFKDLKETK